MIIDASVAFKWFEAEDGSDQARDLVYRAPLIAPALLLSEVANALWKKAVREQIDPSISFDEEVGQLRGLISIVDESDALPRALSIARALVHPVYDCVYLALAELRGSTLVTADVRFLRKVRKSFWAPFVEELS